MTGRRQYVIGVDGGTESLRVGIFDLDGAPVHAASTAYATAFPRPGWAEQSPADWWQAFLTAAASAVHGAGVDPRDVVGIGLDTTSCTPVFLDEAMTPLRPAMLWMDVRAAEQAARISQRPHRALAYCAQAPMSPEWLPAKVLWLQEHEPELYARTVTVCEFVDYLGYLLTGALTASLNTASLRCLYDHRHGGWPRDFFAGVGLGDLVRRLPTPVLPMEAVTGHLLAPVAEAVGLRPGIPVAKGGIDAFVAMVGLDVAAPGRLALITGSSHLQLCHATEPLHARGLFGSYPDAVIPGLHTIEGGQVSTGSVLRWFADDIVGAVPTGSRANVGNGDTLQALAALAATVEPGSEGLVVLDYWQGNRTPHVDGKARGAIWGLTLRHGAGHIARAIMEGIACGTERILSVMREAGVPVGEVIAAGGATRSPLWMQIHADVSNVPIHITRVPDAAGLGAAMLAAVAAGAYQSIPEASAAMVRIVRTIEPNGDRHGVYQDLYGRYCETYERLRDLMHRGPDAGSGSD